MKTKHSNDKHKQLGDHGGSKMTCDDPKECAADGAPALMPSKHPMQHRPGASAMTPAKGTVGLT